MKQEEEEEKKPHASWKLKKKKGICIAVMEEKKNPYFFGLKCTLNPID